MSDKNDPLNKSERNTRRQKEEGLTFAIGRPNRYMSLSSMQFSFAPRSANPCNKGLSPSPTVDKSRSLTMPPMQAPILPISITKLQLCISRTCTYCVEITAQQVDSQ